MTMRVLTHNGKRCWLFADVARQVLGPAYEDSRPLLDKFRRWFLLTYREGSQRDKLKGPRMQEFRDSNKLKGWKGPSMALLYTLDPIKNSIEWGARLSTVPDPLKPLTLEDVTAIQLWTTKIMSAQEQIEALEGRLAELRQIRDLAEQGLKAFRSVESVKVTLQMTFDTLVSDALDGKLPPGTRIEAIKRVLGNLKTNGRATGWWRGHYNDCLEAGEKPFPGDWGLEKLAQAAKKLFPECRNQMIDFRHST